MPDLTWLSLSVGPENSIERALCALIRLTSVGMAAELLFVSRGEIEAWGKAGRVPEEYTSPIRDELAKARASNAEATSGNGNWARYRAEYFGGHGSQVEIAARYNVTKQAVNKACVVKADEPAAPPPEPELEPAPEPEPQPEPAKGRKKR